MAIIDFLLIVVVVMYLIRLIARVVLPMLFQSLVNKAQQQHNPNQNYTRSNKSGSIKVDYIPQKPKSKIPDSEGDFVDYEEIK